MNDEIKKIARSFDLRFIVLFGSVAKNKTHAQSDLDIAVYPEHKLSFKKEMSLRYRLSRHFEREADLSFLHRAPPLLAGQIAQHGKLLFGRKKLYKNFRVAAMKSFIDFEPYFELREKTVRKSIKKYAG